MPVLQLDHPQHGGLRRSDGSYESGPYPRGLGGAAGPDLPGHDRLPDRGQSGSPRRAGGRNAACPMSSADSLLLTAARLATAPVRLGVDMGQAAIDAGRQAQRAIATSSEQALLSLLDGIVARLVDEQVIDRVLERVEAAGVAQRVVDRILED